jgi:hypothetical protein
VLAPARRVGLLCELVGLRLILDLLPLPPPDEPDAVTDLQVGAVEGAALLDGLARRARPR